MSAAVLDPVAPPIRGGDVTAHYICCDETTAMCGAALLGIEVADDDPTPICKYCTYIDAEGLPCPMPGCPGCRCDDCTDGGA